MPLPTRMQRYCQLYVQFHLIILPSELTDSGLGNSRSKEDPSFEELCEQTRMFEEVRVSSNGSSNNNHSNGNGGSNVNIGGGVVGFAPFNSIGIMDETTQSSWSGFEGRRNGVDVMPAKPDTITASAATSANAAPANAFQEVLKHDLL